MNVMKKTSTSKSQSKTEINLKESEQKYRTTIMSVGDGVIATDTEGRVEMMNPVAEELTGWKEEEARGKPLEEIFCIINENTRQTVENPVRRVISEGIVVGLANHSVLIAKDGTERPIADSGSPIRNEKEEITGVVLVFRDQTRERAAHFLLMAEITERKRMEESLATERRFLRQVIDTVPAFICVKTEAGHYALANESLAKAYGTTVSGVEGKSDLDFSPTPEEAAAFRKDDLDVIHSRRTKIIAEEPITYEDGTVHWYSTTKIPVIDPDDSCSKVLVIAMDITEIREHRENLQELVERRTSEMEASQGALIEAQAVAHMGSWEFDPIGDRIKGSDEFYRLFDVSPKDITRFSQFIGRLHPDDRERVQRDVADAMQQNQPYDTDYRVKIGDNGWRNINARGRVFTDTTGKAVSMVGTCLDITERKQAEEALRESQEKYYYLYNNAPVGMYQTRIDGSKILEINNTACEILGYTKEELLGQASALRWADPNRRNEIIKIMSEFGVATNFDADILKKDGTRISCLLSMKIFKEKGYIEGFIADISDRKQTEEALKVSNERLLFATEGANLGIWNWDIVTGELIWSDQCKALFGIPADETMTYQRFSDALHPDDRERTDMAVKDALDNHKDFDIEYRSLWPDESIHWLAAKGRGFYDATGKAVRLEGIVLDIAERKRVEERLINFSKELEQKVKELDKAISDLKRSNLELEQFAYIASHDLQEPLRMVSSYTQLLERRYKDQLDQDAKDFINFAVDGANRMQRLINDLLDYSRVTTRGKPLVKLDLSTVLGQAVANLHNKIIETGSMIVNDDLPFAYGDEGQLIRVFQNLLDNAIKFRGADPPRINVTAKILEDKVQISIADNGIGIDKIYSERVFTIFQRLHNKTDYPGTGIGLAICKRTVERHEGNIWFESEPGNGTTFCFTLNIK
jgi:PAS domain S-box-containing protein